MHKFCKICGIEYLRKGKQNFSWFANSKYCSIPCRGKGACHKKTFRKEESLIEKYQSLLINN